MIVHEGSGIICEERVKDKKIPPSLLRVQKTAKLPELFFENVTFVVEWIEPGG
jgi:hypothetical protein